MKVVHEHKEPGLVSRESFAEVVRSADSPFQDFIRIVNEIGPQPYCSRSLTVPSWFDDAEGAAFCFVVIVVFVSLLTSSRGCQFKFLTHVCNGLLFEVLTDEATK